MPTITKLSDTQLVILNQAAQRSDGMALPLPSQLQAKGGAVQRGLKALLQRGLLIEQSASKPDEEWRRDEDDTSITLVITPAGMAAIGVDADGVVPETAGPTEPVPAGKDDPIGPEPAGGPENAAPGRPDLGKVAGRPGRQGTKDEVITTLLKRETGATLDELTAATGWQAHSVRGFMSGTLKKKRGLAVASERGEDGLQRYRIPA